MPDALLMWSGDALHHHFPDVVAFAVQHCSGAVDRHPDDGLGRNEGEGGITNCMGVTFTCSKAGPGLRKPGLDRLLEVGVVYHAYSAYARGLDGLLGAYQWLDRAPKGRNENGYWWR